MPASTERERVVSLSPAAVARWVARKKVLAAQRTGTPAKHGAGEAATAEGGPTCKAPAKAPAGEEER